MLYSLCYLLGKIGLLKKPADEPGDKDRSAASDRTDGPVTEHGSASTFTYVDADGYSVQLVCEADLAIAVRVTSLLSPPVLRLLVGLVQTGEGGSAAVRSGRGDGGNSGERGNGQSDPEQRGDHPQSQAPEPQPQGGGRTSLSGGCSTALCQPVE